MVSRTSAYRDVSYIQSRLEELRRVYQGRNAKMDDWQRQWLLLRPRSQPGFTPVPSNRVRAVTNISTSMISGKDSLYVHFPITSDNANERLLARKKQVFAKSVIRKFDRAIARDMWEPNLQRVLAQHICLRGWYACRVILEEGADNPFQVRVYDPRNCYMAFSAGLKEFIYEQKMRWGDVWSELSDHYEALGVEEAQNGMGRQVDVIDYWVDVQGEIFNVILVDGVAIKDESYPEFDEIPVVAGVGPGLNLRTSFAELARTFDPNDPFSPGFIDTDFEAHVGLSVADEVSDIGKIESMMLTMLMSNFEKWINPPKFLYTADNQPRRLSFAPDALSVLRGGQFPDKLEEMRHQGAPPETAPLLQAVGGMAQRGTVPDALFGMVEQGLSGNAVSHLVAGATYNIAPRASVLEYVFEQIISMFVKQYARWQQPLKGLRYRDPKDGWQVADLMPWEVYGGEDPNGGAIPYATATPELPDRGEMDAHCEVEVDIVIELPRDMVMKANAAQILRSGPQGPLASERWVQDNVLHIDDPDLEHQRLVKERALLPNASPAILAEAYNLYVKQANQGDEEAVILAQVIGQQLQIASLHMAVEIAQGQGVLANGGQPPGPPGGPGPSGPPVGPGGPPAGGGHAPGPTGPPSGGPPMMLPPGPVGPNGSPAGAPGGPPPPNPPGVNGVVAPPVMTGAVPEGNVPVDEQANPQVGVIDRLRALGLQYGG